LPTGARFLQAKLFRPSVRKFCDAGGPPWKGAGRSLPLFCGAVRRTAPHRSTVIAQNGYEDRPILEVRYLWSIARRNRFRPILPRGLRPRLGRAPGTRAASKGRVPSRKLSRAQRERWRTRNPRPNPYRTTPKSHDPFPLARLSSSDCLGHRGSRCCHSPAWSRAEARSIAGWDSHVPSERCSRPADELRAGLGRADCGPRDPLIRCMVLGLPRSQPTAYLFAGSRFRRAPETCAAHPRSPGYDVRTVAAHREDRRG
jgi:hypothetical protein